MQTKDAAYAERLTRLTSSWWKRALDVQRPYRWNLKRMNLGRTLDVGCGIGRNLKNLSPGSVGIDHNEACVQACRALGLTALETEQFLASSAFKLGTFDSILIAHVLEHLQEDEAVALIETYLPVLKPDGKVALITPQEFAYRRDPTHVRFLDFAKLRSYVERVGLRVIREYSFPVPRVIGKIWPYSEFVMLAVRESKSSA